MRWWISTLTFVAIVEAISYRCENDQVLIAQSFGNDTIRMHCQKLILCGLKNLKCNYDRDQPSCGGKRNFVSHVNQTTPTGPVLHTCCELQHENDHDIANHAGNDCFIYELPDGSTDSEKARNRKAHSVDWNELNVQNNNQVPEHVKSKDVDSVKYQMRLFTLKHKSPPSLIVKAIEKLPEGYRVTICRPRCGNFDSEGEINTKERIFSSNGNRMHGKMRSPAEWAAVSWSSWSSSSWSSWSTTRYIGDESSSGSSKGRVTVRSNRTLTAVKDKIVSNVISTPGFLISDENGTDTVNVNKSDAESGHDNSTVSNLSVKAEDNINRTESFVNSTNESSKYREGPKTSDSDSKNMGSSNNVDKNFTTTTMKLSNNDENNSDKDSTGGDNKKIDKFFAAASPMNNPDSGAMHSKKTSLTVPSCFTGDTEVTTVSGLKRMDELEIGDLVLVPASGNTFKFERIEMFYHRDPQTVAKFVQIKTASGKVLSLTALHLLPLGSCLKLAQAMETVDAVMQLSKFAHRATVGDCVVSVTPIGGLELDSIVAVGRRIEKGIYSPMTVEGAVIANGVLASCFSQIESHYVQKLAFDLLVWIYHATGFLQFTSTATIQEVPSMLNIIHQLSQYVLPFAKY